LLLLFFLLMVVHHEIEFYMNTGTLFLEWHRLLLFPTLITVYVHIIGYTVGEMRRNPALLGDPEALEELEF